MAFHKDSTSFPDVVAKIDQQGMKPFRAEAVWVGSVTYPILTYLSDTGRIERVLKGTYKKTSTEPLMKLIEDGTMKQADVWHNMQTRTPTRPGQVKLSRKKGNGQAPPEPEAQPEPEPTPVAALSVMEQLEGALKRVEDIPAIVGEVYECLFQLVLDSFDSGMIDMLERRMRQVENLQGLLRTSRVELQTKSRKVEELRTQLTRLQQERLRVIPETKILIKDGSERQSPQWGKGS